MFSLFFVWLDLTQECKWKKMEKHSFIILFFSSSKNVILLLSSANNVSIESTVCRIVFHFIARELLVKPIVIHTHGISGETARSRFLFLFDSLCHGIHALLAYFCIFFAKGIRLHHHLLRTATVTGVEFLEAFLGNVTRASNNVKWEALCAMRLHKI